MTSPTRETERQALVDLIGDCCGGGDPFCAGGCLVEKALKKRAATERILTLEERIVSWAEHLKMPPASVVDTRMIHRTAAWNDAMEHVATQLPACLRDFPATATETP